MRLRFITTIAARQLRGAKLPLVIPTAFLVFQLFAASGCGCQPNTEETAVEISPNSITVSNQGIEPNATPLTSGTATIKLDRTQIDAWKDPLQTMEIYVNDVKLGDVSRSGVNTFHFTPRSSGMNMLYLKLTDKVTSDTSAFTAYSGTITRVIPDFETKLGLPTAITATVSQIKSATLVIERKPSKREGWNYKTSDKLVDVLLNDVKVGTLSNGQQRTFDFEPKTGQNTVQITYNNEVSPVVHFMAAADSTNGFITRWEPDGSGYNIALRPANSSEQPVKIVSVVYNPQLQAEIVRRYPPLSIPLGSKQVFARKLITSTSVEISDKSTIIASNGTRFNIGLFYGPLQAGLQHFSGTVSTRSKQTILGNKNQEEDDKELILIGNGKPQIVVLRRNYMTGIAQVLLNGKVASIHIRKPVDEFYSVQ